MAQNRHIGHPEWVNPRYPIVGDLRYIRNTEGKWNRELFNGQFWIPEQYASDRVKNYYNQRLEAYRHIRGLRNN